MSDSEDEVRFSDPMLIKFHQEFTVLRRDFERHANDEQECMRQMLFTQNENTAVIMNLDSTVKDHIRETKWAAGIGDDINTIARFAKFISSVGKFIGSIAIVGAACAWVFHHFDGKP